MLFSPCLWLPFSLSFLDPCAVVAMLSLATPKKTTSVAWYAPEVGPECWADRSEQFRKRRLAAMNTASSSSRSGRSRSAARSPTPSLTELDEKIGVGEDVSLQVALERISSMAGGPTLSNVMTQHADKTYE